MKIAAQLVANSKTTMKLSLWFSPVFEPNDKMGFLLIGKLPHVSQSKSVGLQFLPNGDRHESKIFTGKMNGGQSLFVVQHSMLPFVNEPQNSDKFMQIGPMMRIKPEVVATLDGFKVDIGKNNALTFQTGPMGPVMAELEKCTTTLTEHWGFRSEGLEALSQRAQPIDSSKWLNSNDYPRGLAAFGHVGIVDIRISVSEQGQPLRCDVTSAMGSKEFSAVVCKKLMLRARFQPALDKDGQPAKDLYTERVIFTMR